MPVRPIEPCPRRGATDVGSMNISEWLPGVRDLDSLAMVRLTIVRGNVGPRPLQLCVVMIVRGSSPERKRESVLPCVRRVQVARAGTQRRVGSPGACCVNGTDHRTPFSPIHIREIGQPNSAFSVLHEGEASISWSLHSTIRQRPSGSCSIVQTSRPWNTVGISARP